MFNFCKSHQLKLASFCFAITITSLLTGTASAQLHGPGPSDSGLFFKVINLPSDMVSIDGRIGDRPTTVQLNVNDGGTVSDNFEAKGNSEVNISGGTVGNSFTALSSFLFEAPTEVNISGGTIGSAEFFDSEVSISGGTFTDSLSVYGSDDTGFGSLNVSGGTFVGCFDAFLCGEMNVSGGVFVDSFSFCGGFRSEGELNISGGTFGSVSTFDRCQVNFFGSDFLLNGTPIDNLSDGETITINQRDVTISGTLEDGSPFSYNLNTISNGGVDDAFIDSVITLTLVSPLILGDGNLDGVVDFLDIGPFIALLSSSGFQDEADINEDGAVDFLDIGPFIALLSGS